MISKRTAFWDDIYPDLARPGGLSVNDLTDPTVEDPDLASFSAKLLPANVQMYGMGLAQANHWLLALFAGLIVFGVVQQGRRR